MTFRPKTVEEFKQYLMNDPDTQRIAKALKMKTEDYVFKVMQYVANPNKQPQLYVMDEAEARAQGIKGPYMEDVKKYMQDVIDGKISFTDPLGLRKTAFDDENSQAKFAKGVGSGTPAGDAPAAADAKEGDALKQQLKEQMKKGSTKG